MEVKASLKHLRISPRKTRLVAGVVRGLEVNKAINQLKFLNKKAAKPVLKLLESAIASAVNNYDLDKNNLTIKEIRIDEGKVLKRWMPRAHGRATVLRKKMSHVNLVLSEIVDSGKKEAKKVEVEAPVKLDELSKESKKEKKQDKKEDQTEEEKADEKVKKVSEKPGKMDSKGSSKSFTSKVFRRKSG
ncbi:50S ribosomal protein L22 [Candidatus Falkowbacteria bacterium HGW-Falkowbacteria-1]|jgi:large subunit ribosomal protein L22|uniref:Large ribosomal subunit protein uL22 n=1 Tax=Candidatus Falkowbacteria bacterium HGW-Falkowbacteria-1 TaxID=2013768 RepID=A0A2N2E990_9BACT|nr:MAG: 50S ribosomal protein L22 [Candidatus Falkowbacteria bacterium HGW-Falkowbacteria-1]